MNRSLGPNRLVTLGTRNATRHPVRSLLTLGLLASAMFLVVAVESFHRDPGRDFLNKDAGSGGFPLLGEANLPIYQDLNTEKGRDELRFCDGTRWQPYVRDGEQNGLDDPVGPITEDAATTSARGGLLAEEVFVV